MEAERAVRGLAHRPNGRPWNRRHAATRAGTPGPPRQAAEVDERAGESGKTEQSATGAYVSMRMHCTLHLS